MKTRRCDNCLREVPTELTLHCEHCGNCYCPDCAAGLCICECAGDLSYFD